MSVQGLSRVPRPQTNPVVAHIPSTPAVVFLHEGVVTASFDIKPSKDTAGYARELVSWAMRQNTLPESLVRVAGEAMQVQCAVTRAGRG